MHGDVPQGVYVKQMERISPRLYGNDECGCEETERLKWRWERGLERVQMCGKHKNGSSSAGQLGRLGRARLNVSEC